MGWREFVAPQINYTPKDKRVKRVKRVPLSPILQGDDSKTITTERGRRIRESKLYQELNALNEELNDVFTPGAISWAAENRPDLMRYARGAETAVDAALLTDDGENFKQALERYRTVYLDIFSANPSPHKISGKANQSTTFLKEKNDGL